MKEIVSPPALMPAAHSLSADANRVSEGDNRWENGITFTSQGCEAIFAFTWGCPAELKSEFQNCTPAVGIVPILLETSLEWSTMDMKADPKSRVEETLRIGGSSIVERVLNTGVAETVGAITRTAVSQAVSTADIKGRIIGTETHPDLLTLVPTPNPTAGFPAKNLGTLEAKLIDGSDHTGGAGTIFMSPIDAVTVYDHLLLDGGKLYTKLTGSQVIIGNFLPGVIYGVIGQVDLYLSEIETRETVIRETNTWVGQSEQMVIVAFNGCAVFGQEMEDPPA